MPEEATRDRIVRAATELAEREGLAAVTLRAVGAAAGVSRGAPYRHFRDKADLLSAVAEDGLTHIRQAIVDAAPSGAPTDRLSAALNAYVASARQHPVVYTLIFSAELATDEHPALIRAGLEAYDTFVDLVDAVLHDRDGARSAASQLWAAAHGALTLSLAGHGTKEKGLDDIDSLLRDLASSVLGSVRP